jgi:hypothetical protein
MMDFLFLKKSVLDVAALGGKRPSLEAAGTSVIPVWVRDTSQRNLATGSWS